MNINIPTSANEIIHKLSIAGHKAYVVGGCVRDSILGKEPKDWDICTSATTDELLKIFEGYKIIPTGLKHGTVSIVIGKDIYEVTTFRIDGEYLDNRRPSTVQFTRSLEEDLKRRDFTINAIAYNNKEGLIDPFNGCDDIKNKIIKCVGNATARFNEDALRILRALRFASTLGFKIDEQTELSLIDLKKNLNNISVERINSELCKAVKSNYFSTILNNYKEIFTEFIPEFNSIIGFEQNNPYHIYDIFEHTIHAIESYEKDIDTNESDLIIKLSLLFHDIGKPSCCTVGADGYNHFKGHGKYSADITEKLMKRLRFDKYTINNVVELVKYHDIALQANRKFIKKWLNRLGEVQFRRLLLVRKYDILGQNPYIDNSERINKVFEIHKILDTIIKEKECFSMSQLDISGFDLMQLGYSEGKELGDILKILLQKVIDEDLLNSKEELLNYAKTLMRSNKHN